MMPSIKLKLSMRPITTPVNLLLCGASSCGKSSFIRAFVDMLQISDESAATATEEPGNKDVEAPEESCRVPPFMTLTVSGTGAAADPHAVLLAGSDEFAAAVGPISVPEAGREVQYRLQDCPGYGATLDPAGYLEALLSFIFSQQQKDFTQLQGSRGLPKSLVYGSLAHSVTACLYFLQPHGPSKLDLVLMAGLAKHVALLPVIGKADSMTAGEARDCVRLVQHMLEQPGEYVPGLTAIKAYRSSGSELPFLLHTRSPASAAPGDAASAGHAGLGQLMELLTGDEVYGLLDHAWDSYTAFCSAYEGAGGCSIAALVSAASAAATQAVMPSCTALAKGAKQLQQERQMATELRDELLAVRRELEAEKSKAWALQAQLKSAEADAEVAWGGKEYYVAAFEREQKLLDELWKAVTTYFTRVGRLGIISRHLGSTSKELQARLPELAGASKAAAPRRVTDLLV
uniref:Septin-type G domain-containing protein n=1 Tax=Tetradesmus obliquus TaxID=3088 RepID=A0A383VXV4_TETOB|eukprot:jgi/Sobl393_1/16941/SZX69652.1